MDPAPGTLVGGRFRLIHPLGEGGMGRVWYAEHDLLGTPCAVKIIHAELANSSAVRARFEREARVVATLRSPHVVTVLDYGISAGLPYIAMEYLEGEDLGHRLARTKRLSVAETVDIVAQIARALGKAHGLGMVHRDLKPENVFLVRDGHRDFVKVLDFGVAKVDRASRAGSGHTRAGQLLGTPWYMSPEQAQGLATVDWRSDLWSLGVITFRCLVGKMPFDGPGLGNVLVSIVTEPLPIPSRHAADLPVAFDAWWLRAVARDPLARFQSASSLTEALAQVFAPVALEPALDPLSEETTVELFGKPASMPPRAEVAHSSAPPPRGRPTLRPVSRATGTGEKRSRILGLGLGGLLTGVLLVLGFYGARRARTDLEQIGTASAPPVPPAPGTIPMGADASAHGWPSPVVSLEPDAGAPPVEPAPPASASAPRPTGRQRGRPPAGPTASARETPPPARLRSPFDGPP